MENEILDYEDPKKTPAFHANKSFDQFLIALIFSFVLLLAMFLLMSLFFRIFLNRFSIFVISLLMCTALYYSFLGLRNGLESFNLQEKSTVKKYVATIGNLVIAIIMGMVVLASVVGFLKSIF